MWESTKTIEIQPKSISDVSRLNHSRQHFRKDIIPQCLKNYEQLNNILMRCLIKVTVSYYESMLLKLDQYAAT